jgi:hypothetical protein
MKIQLEISVTEEKGDHGFVIRRELDWDNGYTLFVGMKWIEMGYSFTIEEISYHRQKDLFLVRLKDEKITHHVYNDLEEHFRYMEWL